MMSDLTSSPECDMCLTGPAFHYSTLISVRDASQNGIGRLVCRRIDISPPSPLCNWWICCFFPLLTEDIVIGNKDGAPYGSPFLLLPLNDLSFIFGLERSRSVWTNWGHFNEQNSCRSADVFYYNSPQNVQLPKPSVFSLFHALCLSH